MVKPSSLTLRERNAMRFCSVHSTGTDPSVLFPEGGGVDSRKQKTQYFSPPGRVRFGGKLRAACCDRI